MVISAYNRFYKLKTDGKVFNTVCMTCTGNYICISGIEKSLLQLILSLLCTDKKNTHTHTFENLFPGWDGH